MRQTLVGVGGVGEGSGGCRPFVSRHFHPRDFIRGTRGGIVRLVRKLRHAQLQAAMLRGCRSSSRHHVAEWRHGVHDGDCVAVGLVGGWLGWVIKHVARRYWGVPVNSSLGMHVAAESKRD